ncbi:peptide ABC transporter substrate-binding protein [Clostridium tagluense]|uniref:peptide ABC transporter substrate-binding protein n=1 Tax=Clostridium tagluense TaxID=360422 RepID=UPI001C0CBA69|nr:peptide ABC transporter substrate-binding protein [Clostridium tagluense]MBU3128236.1 peptide ABC transporter substrate-binding protein [Clostridium tagluense]
MKFKLKKSVSILLCFILTLTINLELNTKANALVEKSPPKISSCEITDNRQLLVTTKGYEGMIQYQIFYSQQNSSNINWNLVTTPDMVNGWTLPICGVNLTKIDLSHLKLEPSQYRFAIRVKRSGEKGKYSNKYGEYDDAYSLNAKLEEAASKIPQILNASLNSDPRTLDVSFSTDTYSKQILNEIYEGLTRIDHTADGTNYIAPAGASKWECNQKGDVWTFFLRDNYWSDGVKVTAQHYVDSILRSLDPITDSFYSFLLLPIKNATEFNTSKIKDKNQVGIHAIDASTLQITLEKPSPYFLELTYMNIMKPQRLDLIEKYKDTYGTDIKSIVSNGPFLLKDWLTQNKITLEKNPYYWDKDKVKLQQINFNILRNIDTRMNELYLGNIDFAASLRPEWSEKLQNTNKFNLMTADKATTSYTMFNQNDKYLKNSKIRKAFILAENRTEKIKDIYKGVGEPAYSFCPTSIPIYQGTPVKKAIKSPVIKLMEENKDPKALLMEGLKEIGEDVNSSKMNITLLQSGTSPMDIESAEFMKKSYKDILGVELKIQYEEWAVCMKNMDDGKYQITQASWVGDYNSPLSYLEMWTSSAGTFNTGFINKEYDELISKARVTMNPAESFEYLKKAEDILIYEEGVISPSVFTKHNFFYRKEVKNLMYNPFTEFEFKYVEISPAL